MLITCRRCQTPFAPDPARDPREATCPKCGAPAAPEPPPASRPQQDTLRFDAAQLAELRHRSATPDVTPRMPMPSVPFELRREVSEGAGGRSSATSLPSKPEARQAPGAAKAASSVPAPGPRILVRLLVLLLVFVLAVAALTAVGILDAARLRDVFGGR